MMIGQMNIYDYLPRPFDPVRSVAMSAGVHWVDGKERLIDLCNTDPDIDLWAEAVREQYCPYGGSGRYGMAGGPSSVRGWDMRSDHISIEFYNGSGERQTKIISWKEFAREVADIIWSSDAEEWLGDDRN